MGPKGDIPAKIQIKQQGENDRQFRCKCQKTYKSYPALYTHIKNKHSEQIGEYKQGSKRPKQSEIDKGRPKKHRARPAQADEQGDLLNIIELGVLQIETNLKDKKYQDDIKFQVLTGNRKLEYADLRSHYDTEKQQIIEKIRQVYADQEVSSVIDELNGRDLNDLKTQIPVKIYKESIKFKQQLIQHFNAITAAKILLHIQLLEIEESSNETEKINDKNEITFSINTVSVIKLAENTIWNGIENITDTIRGTVKKWKEKVTILSNKSSNVSNHDSQQQASHEDRQQFEGDNGTKQYQRKQQRPDQYLDYISKD